MSASELWSSWAKRWNAFQEAYVPARDLQLRLIAEYVALARPNDPVCVLDLCCGPGSAAAAILGVRPQAIVVAVDWDPWLLELGRRTAAGGDRIAWVEADIVDATWTERLPRAQFDAVVTTTAMQWFATDQLAAIYRAVADLLVPGGVFLSSDVVPAGPESVRRLAAEAHRRWHERAVAESPRLHWTAFWKAARAEPEFTGLLEERDRRMAWRHPRDSRSRENHDRALAQAGFAEVGEVWRHHENAVLLAVRGPVPA